MMDELIINLHNVSQLLLPILGLICLVFLAMILYNVNKTVKRLSTTIDKVDETIVSTSNKIDQLEGPLNTLNSVSKTVDIVNDSAVGAVNSAVKFSLKHSDSIINWGKNVFSKSSNKKDSLDEQEEDFGIYE